MRTLENFFRTTARVVAESSILRFTAPMYSSFGVFDWVHQRSPLQNIKTTPQLRDPFSEVLFLRLFLRLFLTLALLRTFFG